MSTTAHDHHHDDENHANVVRLPVRRADTTPTPDTDGLEPDGAVVGELLTEEQSAELDRRMAAARVREAAGAVVRVVRHERTRTVGRAVLRNAGYAVAGARIRREERRARRKHLDLEQAITTLRVNAKSAEDFHVLRELEEVLERRRSGAAQRGRERRIEILRWSGGAVLLLAGGHVVFLGVSAVQTVVGAASLTDRWNDMVEFWSTVVELSPVGGYWWTWALVGAGTWAVRTIPVGRDRGTLPVWAGEDAQGVPADGRDIIVDESAVLSALRHLGGLPLLKQAFKQGWGSSITPTWLQQPHRDGDGVRMQLVLPRGVPVVDIVKRLPVFAHNLARLPVEVWPSEAKDRAGVLDLWVADPGALSKPVPPWPLLAEDGPTDFFAALPVGINIRGEIVRALLFEKNYAAAGVMGSGKSSLFITLVAGAILDPLVEVDVFVLAENFDYDPMKPRLRTLRTGADRDTMTACLDTLKALYDELTERGQALREHKERKVNRKIAAKDARLRPRVVVIDECQALFMDEEYGETAADLVTKLISAARKYAIVLMFATPEASTASLPRKIMAVTACKACFAIGDQQSNDAILGTGSYKAGISAVSLDPKTDESDGDVGTAMVRGIMAKPGLLRGFYLSPDELTEVTERALELRAGYVPAPTGDDERPQDVDFLADLDRVLTGHKHLRTAQVLRTLIDLRPDHYGKWTNKTLAAALAEAGVPIVKRDRGQSAVDTNDVAEAITMRDMDNGMDTDDHADDED